MQHIYDNLVAALGIAASLGLVSAIFYMAYHFVMIAVCYYRDTPPDQRAHTRPTYRTLANMAKLHVRKGVLGLLAFLGFFLLMLLLDSRN